MIYEVAAPIAMIVGFSGCIFWVFRKKKKCIPVEAMCVGVKRGTGARYMYFTSKTSTWRFFFDGREYTIVDQGCGGDTDKRQVGDRCIVYVDPDNVEKSLTPRYSYLVRTALIGVALGVFLLALCLVMFVQGVPH